MPLDHEIEVWDPSGSSYIWFRAPSLPANSTTSFYLYYYNPTGSCAQSPTTLWDSSFRAVWHLNDDPASANLIDSKNGNSAVPYNGPVSMTGTPTVRGVQFDGVNDYLQAPDSVSLRVGSDLTLETIVYFNAVFAQASYLIEKGLTDNDNYALFATKDGFTTCAPVAYCLNLELKDTTNTYVYYPETAQVIPFAGWAHLATVFNDTANTLTFYIDGTAVQTVAMTNALKSSWPHPLTIGMQNFAGSPFNLNGKLDEVRISAAARSADWIRATYLNLLMPVGFISYGSAEAY